MNPRGFGNQPTVATGRKGEQKLVDDYEHMLERHLWLSDFDKIKILAMRVDGWSIDEITKEIGCTQTPVYTALKEFRDAGVDVPPSKVRNQHTAPKYDYQQFADDWNAGTSVHELADKYETTVGAIYRRVRRLRMKGYELRHRRKQDPPAPPKVKSRKRKK